MTPFRKALMAAAPMEHLPHYHGFPWDIDTVDGSVYCWSCASRGLQGHRYQDLGIKVTKSRKLLGDNPQCAWCGQTATGPKKRSRKKSNAGRIARELAALVSAIGKII